MLSLSPSPSPPQQAGAPPTPQPHPPLHSPRPRPRPRARPLGLSCVAPAVSLHSSALARCAAAASAAGISSSSSSASGSAALATAPRTPRSKGAFRSAAPARHYAPASVFSAAPPRRAPAAATGSVAAPRPRPPPAAAPRPALASPAAPPPPAAAARPAPSVIYVPDSDEEADSPAPAPARVPPIRHHTTSPVKRVPGHAAPSAAATPKRSHTTSPVKRLTAPPSACGDSIPAHAGPSKPPPPAADHDGHRSASPASAPLSLPRAPRAAAAPPAHVDAAGRSLLFAATLPSAPAAAVAAEAPSASQLDLRTLLKASSSLDLEHLTSLRLAAAAEKERARAAAQEQARAERAAAQAEVDRLRERERRLERERLAWLAGRAPSPVCETLEPPEDTPRLSGERALVPLDNVAFAASKPTTPRRRHRARSASVSSASSADEPLRGKLVQSKLSVQVALPKTDELALLNAAAPARFRVLPRCLLCGTSFAASHAGPKRKAHHLTCLATPVPGRPLLTPGDVLALLASEEQRLARLELEAQRAEEAAITTFERFCAAGPGAKPARQRPSRLRKLGVDGLRVSCADEAWQRLVESLGPLPEAAIDSICEAAPLHTSDEAEARRQASSPRASKRRRVAIKPSRLAELQRARSAATPHRRGLGFRGPLFGGEERLFAAIARPLVRKEREEDAIARRALAQQQAKASLA